MAKAFDKVFCVLPRTIIFGSIAIFSLCFTGYPIYTIAGDSWLRHIGGFLMTSGTILVFTMLFLIPIDIYVLRHKKRKQKAGSQYDSYELCAYGICER